MAQAKAGDKVQVHYTGKLEDGTVFDSSENRQPLEFTLGEGNVIAGFESAVEGLSAGETTTAKISPEEGYGERRDDMVLQVDQAQLPENLDPEVGQQLQLQLQNGQQIPVVVTDVENGSVTIDANHPLAGKTLIFDIELVDVNEA
ncbi:MAG: FKBP-type peptidyl-prolyl cis-trans isomerase [Bacteroidota bacterium]